MINNLEWRGIDRCFVLLSQSMVNAVYLTKKAEVLINQYLGSVESLGK